MDLIVFDIDGTLIQSHAKEVDCFANALKRVLGIQSIDCDLNNYEHITDSGILRECVNKAFNRLPTESEMQAVEDYYLEHFTATIAHDPIQLIDGSKTLLEKLRAHSQIALAVATGSHYRAAQLKLSHVAPEWQTIPISSSNDSIARITIMESAHQKAKQFYSVEQFNRIIYIGDGPWDVKATKQLQWDFIGVASNFDKRTLHEWGAKCVIDNYLAPTDLIQLIQNANLSL